MNKSGPIKVAIPITGEDLVNNISILEAIIIGRARRRGGEALIGTIQEMKAVMSEMEKPIIADIPMPRIKIAPSTQGQN